MLTQLTNRSIFGKRTWLALAAVLALLVIGFSLMAPQPAEAHCDAVDGPVVTAARGALEEGDVTLILPYVKADAEAELTAAFEQTLQVRKRGGDARELADRYFFETAVRLHRAGEGAPYTGLKYDAGFGPALEAADEALVTGELDGVYAVLSEAIEHGVAEHYEQILAARAHEAEAGTVAAARERVEAELMFEQYVYGIHEAAMGAAAHGEGEAH